MRWLRISGLSFAGWPAKARLVISTLLLAAFMYPCVSGAAGAAEYKSVLSAAPAAAITNGPRNEKKIALTFDACSTRRPSAYDDRVIAILERTRTPATLFLGGKWMKDEPGHTRELAGNPLFELANHTYIHPHLTRASDERIRKELSMTQDEMYALTGRRATLFRPPYGEYDSRVVRIAASMGLTTIEYDLPSGDPDIHATKQRLIDWVTRKARGGSIIVMHMNRRGWHTAEALPDIIRILRMKGYKLVTVGELLRDMHR